MGNLPPTPEELAAAVREAFRKSPPLTGRALYAQLVRKGFINARGQVTRLIGGSAELEPNYETWTAADHIPPRKNGRQGREPS
jgi:hypothetical protein